MKEWGTFKYFRNQISIMRIAKVDLWNSPSEHGLAARIDQFSSIHLTLISQKATLRSHDERIAHGGEYRCSQR